MRDFNLPRTLDIAVSPYHLATREAPAMLALILGSRVVTLMPHPAQGQSREAVKAAVDAAPRYLRLMESWRWCGPLWQSGVIASGVDGEEVAQELASVYSDIEHAVGLAPLRPLTRSANQRAAESPDKSLDFLAADVLKGGPDPGINIPICAAIDRFAVRHHFCVVRASGSGGGGGTSGGGGATSLAQRAEARLATRVFSFAMPILLRAGGGRIERLRDDLTKPLNTLRAAIDSAIDAALGSRNKASDAALIRTRADAITLAAAAYAKAFSAWAESGGASGDDENHERVVPGYVSVTGQIMPADAVLRSSRAALHAIQATGGGARDADLMPIPVESLFTLTVREMTVQPE